MSFGRNDMILLLAIGVPTLLILAYVVIGRAWLKERPWASGFFAKVEPIEIALWRKSETILWARFQQVLGVVLTLLTQLGQLDLSPLFPLLPDNMKWLPAFLPLIISVAGRIEEWNRLRTTKPVELVEAPDAISAGTRAALIEATAAQENAVIAVEVEKAERIATGETLT
jgi:hypothetical protein